MNRKAYKKAWNTAKAIRELIIEGDNAREYGDYETYLKAQEAVEHWDIGLMVDCQGDYDVMRHIETAVDQRETQPRRRRFFK